MSAAAGDAVDRIAVDLKIPPCPALLAAFTAELRKDDPDTRVLVGLISRDAGLAAAILKTVNSPLFGLRRKAADLLQALAILGLRGAAHLITGLMLRQAFPAASGSAMQRYWDDSTRIAEAAVAVAGRARGVSRDEAHTYALFRDCGIAVMIAKFPDYGDILDAHAAAPGPDLAQRESGRYRYDHARVGFALSRSWQLPDSLSRTILCHHDIGAIAMRTGDAAGASPALAALGLVAEQVAALRAGGTVTGEWTAHEQFAFDALQITPEDVVALVQ